jgi:hypothetical protein
LEEVQTFREVFGVNEDVEVGAGAESGVAVERLCQSHALEGDHWDSGPAEPRQHADELLGQKDVANRINAESVRQLPADRRGHAAKVERAKAVIEQGNQAVGSSPFEKHVPEHSRFQPLDCPLRHFG